MKRHHALKFSLSHSYVNLTKISACVRTYEFMCEMVFTAEFTFLLGGKKLSPVHHFTLRLLPLPFTKEIL